MPKERKTPQEKKKQSLQKDHFTYAESVHGFRKGWPKKKALANREIRRKSDALLAKSKPEISAADAELVTGDVTEWLIKKSISRKRLQKRSTVSLGEKIQHKLQKRAETVGRRINRHAKYEGFVRDALATLHSLEGEALVECIRRLARLEQGGDPVEWLRIKNSTEPLDRALHVLEQLARGNGSLRDALRRSKDLCASFQSIRKIASRTYAKLERPALRKMEQKAEISKRLKEQLRQKNDSPVPAIAGPEDRPGQ